jgi:hypothetical protein
MNRRWESEKGRKEKRVDSKVEEREKNDSYMGG